MSIQLAVAGLGRLTLIDPDRLESPNLGRHMLGAEDLGKFKSQAMRHRLLQDLPVLDVTALDTYIEWVMGQNPIFSRMLIWLLSRQLTGNQSLPSGKRKPPERNGADTGPE